MGKESLSAMIIGIIVMFVFIIMGIRQMNSKSPVSFYALDVQPKDSEISDIKAWNHCHGLMWVFYGLFFGTGLLIALLMNHEILSVLIIMISAIGPLPIMNRRHKDLLGRYANINGAKA
jgi:hypothetical protein